MGNSSFESEAQMFKSTRFGVLGVRVAASRAFLARSLCSSIQSSCQRCPRHGIRMRSVSSALVIATSRQKPSASRCNCTSATASSTEATADGSSFFSNTCSFVSIDWVTNPIVCATGTRNLSEVYTSGHKNAPKVDIFVVFNLTKPCYVTFFSLISV